MAAGRPRSFCTEKALDSAMQVFWRKGYEGTSMVDLTEAIGINSPSLYAAFGSKEGLFRAVLERYDARRKTFMENLMAATTAREVAERFLHGVADFAADTGGKNPSRLSAAAERPVLRRFGYTRRTGAPSCREGSGAARTF